MSSIQAQVRAEYARHGAVSAMAWPQPRPVAVVQHFAALVPSGSWYYMAGVGVFARTEQHARRYRRARVKHLPLGQKDRMLRRSS